MKLTIFSQPVFYISSLENICYRYTDTKTRKKHAADKSLIQNFLLTRYKNAISIRLDGVETTDMNPPKHLQWVISVDCMVDGEQHSITISCDQKNQVAALTDDEFHELLRQSEPTTPTSALHHLQPTACR
jgi:hypothetical protein